MDNRNRQLKLFGTPLSKSLENEAAPGADTGPDTRRRARLDRHQIVQDEQGRRRFHGAFTGGFSAGYHNTVDSVQGFRPKSFTSHRGRGRRDGGSLFDHRPEDYMDEEDFGEFGIAPKKFRVTSDFSDRGAGPSLSQAKAGLPLVINESIGEKILRCMTKERRKSDRFPDTPVKRKDDFHGLGYKTLNNKRFTASDNDKSLFVAPLKSGQHIKISGEAFGVGVLEDDEDNLYDINEYGYDNPSNYDFSSSKSTTTTRSKQSEDKPPTYIPTPDEHTRQLDGFVLAKDLELGSCDEECLKYPLPIIEESWKMPVRTEPLIKVPDESELNRHNLNLYKKQADTFSDKFTTGVPDQSKSTGPIEDRAGLVPYSDLKAMEVKTSGSIELALEACPTEGQTVHRQVVEWRPCSLLCKHFNVPNPFPDNKYFGVKPGVLTGQQDGILSQHVSKDEIESIEKLAPFELRRSIFNVRFNDDCDTSSNEDDYDDEPQIIDCDPGESVINLATDDNCLVAEVVDDDNRSEDCEPESEIVVVEVPKKEPEVIVLSSSSSETSSRKSGRSTPINDTDDDDDAYGPPLPPARHTLKELDRHASRSHRSDSSSNKFHRRSTKKKKKKKSPNKDSMRKRHRMSG